MPDSHFTRQLLAVYNPLFHPQTIRAHVEQLQKRSYVWWGRFQGEGDRMSAVDARARWPHVAELADERAATKEPTVMYVTDFVALHACKVTDIVFGDDPKGAQRNGSLVYYAAHLVPMWLRVEDIRALSYDQMTTLDFFKNGLGVVRSGSTRGGDVRAGSPYDPYATSERGYPIVVDGPSCDEVFVRPPRGKLRWVQMDDAAAPKPVEVARKELAKKLEGMWKRLESESRDQLAHAWNVAKSIERGEDTSAPMGFMGLALAVETEARALVREIEHLCARVQVGKAREAQAMIWAIREEQNKLRSSHGPNEWTLGAWVNLLKRFERECRRETAALKLAAFGELCADRRWLERMAGLRNSASHPGNVQKDQHREALLRFFKEGGAELARVVEAKEGVKRGG